MSSRFFSLAIILYFACFLFVSDSSGVSSKQKTATKKRALLVGIGNYLPEDYENEYKEIWNKFVGRPKAERLIRDDFEEFCDKENIDKFCSGFLRDPNQTTASEHKEIRDFFELIQKPEFDEAKKILLNAKNLYGDFILRKRNVSVTKFNLGKGPHNDVLNMARLLSLKYQFDEIYILLDKSSLRTATARKIEAIRVAPGTKITLLEELPTNEGITETFRKKLIDPISNQCGEDKRACDKSLFYFSGHGSKRPNLHDKFEIDQLDETLVTLDVQFGKPDLRDDDMAQLYNEALRKSSLTVITDSCHSGDNLKAPLEMAAPKAISKDPRPVARSETLEPTNPVEYGLLFFAASGEKETAKSLPALPDLFDTNGRNNEQGNFTHHFVKTLVSINDTTAFEVFERTRRVMGTRHQTPVGKGLEGKNVNFYGGTVESNKFGFQKIDTNSFRINGGLLNGLRKGIELGSEEDKQVCLEIVSAGITDSLASPCRTSSSPAKQGANRLIQTTWLTPTDENALRFWIPPSAPIKDIEQILEDFGRFIVSGTEQEVSKLLYFDGTNWQLCRVESTCQSLDLSALIPKEDDKILFIRPLEKKLKDKLEAEFKTLNFGIKSVHDLASSNYFLLRQQGINEFTWFKRSVIKWRDNPINEGIGEDFLPAETRIVNSSESEDKKSKLTVLAQRLGKMHSWITLRLFSSPNSGISPGLLVRKNGKVINSNDTVTKGDYIRFSIEKPEQEEPAKRFFYLVSFNEKAEMNFENESSFEQCSKSTERDCFLEERVPIPEKFGNKVIILLSTDNEIAAARSLLNSEGVKSIQSNPLVTLINQMQSGQKDADPQPTFQDWSVQTFFLRFEEGNP